MNLTTATLTATAATYTPSTANAAGTIIGVLLILFTAAAIMRMGLRFIKFIIRSTSLILLAAFFGYLIYF